MEMRSLEAWRALLGPAAAGMSDADVLEHREQTYGLARRIYEGYRLSLRPAGEVGLQRVDYPRRPRRARAPVTRPAAR